MSEGFSQTVSQSVSHPFSPKNVLRFHLEPQTGKFGVDFEIIFKTKQGNYDGQTNRPDDRRTEL